MVNARSAGVATLLATVAAACAGVLASCKKPLETNAGDAGVAVEASGDAALADAAASASALPVQTSTSPALTDGPQLRPLPDAGSVAPPVSFSGNYRCPKGAMELVQNGRVVTSTMHGKASTDTVVACSVNGDVCTGSVREIQMVRGKPPKVMHVKSVTLSRTQTGDVVYQVADPKEHPALCHKH